MFMICSLDNLVALVDKHQEFPSWPVTLIQPSYSRSFAHGNIPICKFSPSMFSHAFSTYIISSRSTFSSLTQLLLSPSFGLPVLLFIWNTYLAIIFALYLQFLVLFYLLNECSFKGPNNVFN